MSEFINTTIGECCEILDSSRIPLNEEERNKIPGNIPYYGANGVQDYIDKYIFDEDLILIAEDGGNFESYETRPIAYRISGKSWVNNHAHILRALKRYNQDYIFYSLVNKNILNYIVGGTRSKLNQRELKTITISIPQQKSEQTAIAHILSTVDKAIEQTEKLIAKYKRIKTGLMRDLLTKGIDENGNIRSEKTHKFKDSPLGRIPVEWEVHSLEEISTLITDGSHNSPKSQSSPYVIATVKDMLDDDFNYDQCTQISETDFNLLSKQNCAPIFGDVLLSKDGTIGNSFVYKTNRKIIVLSSIAIIRPKDKYDPYYLNYLLQSFYFDIQLLQIQSGSALKRIVVRDIKKLAFPFPANNIEQKLIAAKIHNMDEYIKIQQVEKNKLSKLKSGLMQDLLTGKVRVPEELIEEINNTVNLNN